MTHKQSGNPLLCLLAFIVLSMQKDLKVRLYPRLVRMLKTSLKVRLWSISNGKWGENGAIPNIKTLLRMRAHMRCDAVRNSLTSTSFRKLTTPESKLTKHSQSLLSRSIPYFPLHNKHMIFHV